MKLYQSIIAVVVCCSGWIMSGCSDWLDYTPKDKQTYEQQFSTSAGFYNAVNGVYNKMSSSSLYGYNLSYGPLDIMAQCYKVASGNENLSEYKTYTWSGKNASKTFTAIWAQAYSTILNINLLLEAAETNGQSVLKESDYKLIRGEMLAARAFLHFDLLRLYGPVYSRNPNGLSIPFNDGVEAVRRERLPAGQLITEKLLPDLEIAQGLLKEVDPVITKGTLNSDGGVQGNWERYRQLRMNYYAVTLLKARIYIWIGDYGNALSEALKITDDAKVKEWFPFVEPSKLLANNTNPDRIFSSECLFGYYNSSMGNIFLNAFSGSLDVLELLQPRKGYIGILFSATNDYRRQSQWTGSTSSSGGDFDFVKYKSFTADKKNPEFWATYYGLMRISEAYYIAAEAYLNQDNLLKACEYMNVMFGARGVEKLDAEATTKTNVLEQIKMEYVREMRGEGQLFYLFKRFYQNFGSWSDGEPALNGAEEPFFDTPSDSRYVIPIPTAETN